MYLEQSKYTTLTVKGQMDIQKLIVFLNFGNIYQNNISNHLQVSDTIVVSFNEVFHEF